MSSQRRNERGRPTIIAARGRRGSEYKKSRSSQAGVNTKVNYASNDKKSLCMIEINSVGFGCFRFLSIPYINTCY